MVTFTAPDGTLLAYRAVGSGAPLVCLAGGPMRASRYLGDLGGLADRVPLVLLDHRGTGESAEPADPASYRCDRLVDDVEALRRALGADRIDLLGHSAGGSLTVRYAERYPERVRSLVLATPSTRAVGVAVTADARRAAMERRSGEPWYAEGMAAFEAIQRDENSDWEPLIPFYYGRWDDVARAHHAAEVAETNDVAAATYNDDAAFDPPATRAALALLQAPVLLIGGEFDLVTPPEAAEEFAGLFPNARFVLQPGTSHFPWLDNPDAFVKTVADFLA